MIKFLNKNKDKPYIKFKETYEKAIFANQNIVEAISISSYSVSSNEVDSRFVNLKFVDNTDFIFFSNYLSPKASQFSSHDQISATIFWDSINVQIRMKATIKRTTKDFNKQYFYERSKKKNALAISSNQSKVIRSYQEVKDNYYRTLQDDSLKECPDYWGGFSFTPYYFEFWTGHESRLNKREVYILNDLNWESCILQP